MQEELIAPCGMNCAVCSRYLALRNDVRSKGIGMVYCSGCRPRNRQCAHLMKTCRLLLNGLVKYCYECPDFPCEILSHLDKRYKTLFRMSMIENLEYIRANGTVQLIRREYEKWRCPACGKVICCHNGICFSCGLSRLKNKKQKYRWEDD